MFLMNFLISCKTDLGDNFLQTSNLHTPWYLAFRCIVVSEKELKRNKQRLAIIRSAESENVSIPANSTVTLRCITSKELNYHQTCAMLVPTEKSVLTDDCDITPAAVHYTFGKNGIVDVQISNVTTSTFNVSPGAVVCELQPVSVDLDYGVVDADNSGESNYFPQTIRDWNDLPESLISSSELSDDSVSKFTSLVRARD